VASAACGLAPTAPVLVAARVLQGGAWSGLGGLATATGPLVGGELIAAASWRWVFFINLPVAAAVIAICVRHVPESRDPGATGPVDGRGALLAVLGLAGVTYGLIEGAARGWGSPVIVAALVGGVVALSAFFVAERARPDPMLPLVLFRDRQFAAANAVTFVVYGALGGALFLLPVELQVVDGYSPLGAGLSLLPVTALMLTFSARSGRLAARIGPRVQMSVGPLVVGLGLALLTRATHGSDYVTHVLPAVAVFGSGLALTVAPLTATAMGAAPPERAGVASATNNVVARTAGLLTVATLPVAAGPCGACSA
jgi:predicted MFS family arabinose efflux permease